MVKIGSVEVEVKPTVTLESAVACLMLVNMFFSSNGDYRLRIAWNEAEGCEQWELTDEPRMRDGA